MKLTHCVTIIILSSISRHFLRSKRERLMWMSRPSVCDLATATKPSVEFVSIRYVISLQKFITSEYQENHLGDCYIPSQDRKQIFNHNFCIFWMIWSGWGKKVSKLYFGVCMNFVKIGIVKAILYRRAQMSHYPISCTDDSTWIKFGTDNLHEVLNNFKFCENRPNWLHSTLGGAKWIHSSKFHKHFFYLNEIRWKKFTNNSVGQLYHEIVRSFESMRLLSNVCILRGVVHTQSCFV